MNNKQIDKQEAKYKKHLDKEFRTLFYKVSAKVLGNWFLRLFTLGRKGKGLEGTKKDKQAIIKDLLKCNNIDIVHYLSKAPFKNVEEYLKQVNNWLELETIAYSYAVPLTYEIGTFEQVTELIRLRHRYLDLRKAIFNIT
jgi:hypothetical protein